MPDDPRSGGRPADRCRAVRSERPTATPEERDRPRAPVDRARPSGVGSIFPRRVEVGMTGLLVSPDVPLLVLVDATSTAELALVEDALTGVGDRPATVLPLRGEALAGPLADADPDTVVTAVRVGRPRSPSTGASAASSATGSRLRGTRPRRSKPAPGSGARSAHWPPGWSFPRTRS